MRFSFPIRVADRGRLNSAVYTIDSLQADVTQKSRGTSNT